MKNFLARVFRKSNSKLIYPQLWLALKFRKLIFFISTIFYRFWLKRTNSSRQYILNDIDGNIAMEVDISKVMGAAFYWIGFHEFKEWRYLQRFLTPDMVFLDVGANQGEYSLFAAKRLTKGEVIAFEPVDEIFEKLHDNIALNHFTNIKTLKTGLSDAKGILPIYEMQAAGANHEGLATLYQSELRGKLIQQINLDTLDNLSSELKLDRIDFIKVDIEGAELSMLKGAKDTIARFRPQVMVEMNDDTFKAAGYSKTDVIEFFEELRYKAHFINKQGVLIPIVSFEVFANVIFVPQ